jgi:hypothetical protein
MSQGIAFVLCITPVDGVSMDTLEREIRGTRVEGEDLVWQQSKLCDFEVNWDDVNEDEQNDMNDGEEIDAGHQDKSNLAPNQHSRPIDPRLLIACSISRPSISAQQDLSTILSSLDVAQAVEVWVSSPACIPISPLTLPDLCIPPTAFTDTIATNTFLANGMLASRHALSNEITSKIRDAAFKRIERAHSTLAKRFPEVRLGYDAFAFREIGSRGENRFDLLFDPNDEVTAIVK